MAFRPRIQNYRRISQDGYSFASKLEASLYWQLKLLVLAKKIEILGVQNCVYLTDARIKYVADFWVKNLETGCEEWHEAKGFESDRWPIIKKLWAHYGPGKLTVHKGRHTRLYVDEVIIPA